MMLTERIRKAVESWQDGPGRTRGERAARIVLLSTLALFLLGLLLRDVSSARMSSQLFAYPFQFDESEGMIAAETMLLDRGNDIYLKPTPTLFVAAPYPPLYYLLTWPVQHLVGQQPSFKIGRALSIFATIVSGVAIFGLAATLSGSLFAGALAAAMWWALGLVAFWGSLVKPDLLALTFGLLGLLWLLARPPAQVWAALPFFIAAFYTKQTAIAAGVAAAAWLLIVRPKTGVWFSALLFACAALPAVALNILTDGGYFYHMFTIHDLPWFADRFRDFALGFIGTYGVFLLPGMAAIVAASTWWVARRVKGASGEPETSDGALLLLIYFGLSLVAATGAGTFGGNHNHFLEWAAASCVGLGVGAGLALRLRAWQGKLACALLALLMLTQVPGLFNTPRWLGLQLRVPPDSYTQGMNNVFQYVTNNSGEAYSDNVGLLLLAHKKLWSTDPFTQKHATYYGRWDESKLVEAIRQKRFSQLIFRIEVMAPDAGAGDVSPGILQAVRDNYTLDQRNVENIYVPK